MRAALAIAILVLAGCSNNAGRFDAEYRASRSLLQSEQYTLALNQIDAALQRAGHGNDAHILWRFRLLKAEALIAERRAADAAALLKSEPPDGPGWTEYRARALLLKGTAAYFLARYSEAQDLLARALTLAQESGSASIATEVQLRQAYLLMNQGRFDAAETALRGVIGSASALHDASLEATATGSLGYVLLTGARYDEAIVWLERARDLHTSLGAHRSVARDALNLGSCYHRLGDYDRARHYYDEARAGFANTGDLFDEQIIAGDTGTLLYDTGNYAGAAEAYRRALEIARQVHNDEWVDRWTTSLASLTAETGDWNTAERYNDEALALERRLHASPADAAGLSTAGRIAAGRGQLTEAEQLFREAIRRPASDPRYTLIAHTKLANLYQQTNRPRLAEGEFQTALSSIDRLNAGLIKDDYRFGYLASLINFYREYIEFLMASHQPERALEIAESSRSHVLAEKSGRPEAVQPHTAAAYRELARRDRAVLLEYWLGEDRSYLWVITARRIQNYVLPPAKSIRPLVEAYRSVTMAARNPLEVAGDTGRKLYEILLAPAEEDLCANCRVILVPDRELYSLNFETLPAGGASSRFWIEQARVEIAPSLDYLADSSRRQSARGNGLLAIGDAGSSLPEYPKLEFAAREMDSIRSSMNHAEAKVLRGPDAVPSAYAGAQPGRFGFIHFAAHAAANTQSPLDSAIVLSGPPDRCRLFARDIMAVPLSAELVTISACRSAGAKTYAGEGPVGLAWAFLRAGARNVIAGLWDVNDRSTEQLMARLYEGIVGGLPPADALRAAKLSFIGGGGSYAKPFYWAPFQVYTGAAE